MRARTVWDHLTADDRGQLATVDVVERGEVLAQDLLELAVRLEQLVVAATPVERRRVRELPLSRQKLV